MWKVGLKQVFPHGNTTPPPTVSDVGHGQFSRARPTPSSASMTSLRSTTSVSAVKQQSAKGKEDCGSVGQEGAAGGFDGDGDAVEGAGEAEG